MDEEAKKEALYKEINAAVLAAINKQLDIWGFSKEQSLRTHFSNAANFLAPANPNLSVEMEYEAWKNELRDTIRVKDQDKPLMGLIFLKHNENAQRINSLLSYSSKIENYERNRLREELVDGARRENGDELVPDYKAINVAITAVLRCIGKRKAFEIIENKKEIGRV